MKDKALVYIHGKGGTASASEQFMSLILRLERPSQGVKK